MLTTAGGTEFEASDASGDKDPCTVHGMCDMGARATLTRAFTTGSEIVVCAGCADRILSVAKAAS